MSGTADYASGVWVFFVILFDSSDSAISVFTHFSMISSENSRSALDDKKCGEGGRETAYFMDWHLIYHGIILTQSRYSIHTTDTPHKDRLATHPQTQDTQHTDMRCALHTLKYYTVSGQNTIGIYITLLVLIQLTDIEQHAVNNNWLLKL